MELVKKRHKICSDESDAYFKGVVTHIDFNHFIFTIDEKAKVYAGIYYAISRETYFPDLKSTVSFANIDIIEDDVFLSPKSVMFCDKFSYVKSENYSKFLDIIKQSELNFRDLPYIMDEINHLNDAFRVKFLVKYNLPCIEDLILEILKLIPPNDCFNSYREKSYLKLFELITPRNYVPENVVRIASPVPWSPGVQIFKNKECLIGYLSVDFKLGFIILSDTQAKIFCVIAPNNRADYSRKLSFLLNSIVLVRNYYVFTENTRGENSLLYIFVNITDVSQVAKSQVLIKRPLMTGPKTVINLRVLHRSTVSFKDDSFECYIFCSIKLSKAQKYKDCFVILSKRQFAKYPLFNCDDEYVVTSNSPLFATQITSFKGSKTYKMNTCNFEVFYFPSDATMSLISVGSEASSAISHDFSMLTVPEAKVELDENARKVEKELHKDTYDILKGKRYCPDLVTFEAVIIKRKTLPPFDTPTPKLNQDKFLGTIGPDTHQIVFKAPRAVRTKDLVGRQMAAKQEVKFYEHEKESAEKIYQANQEAKIPKNEIIPLYMHNWKQLLTPLGLIPGMKVAVRKVQMNNKSSKYFKPVFVTQLEPLEYAPLQEFSSTPELMNNSNWGPPTPLSIARHIPKSVLCWGPAISTKFTAFKYQLTCQYCDDVYAPGQISCCDGPQNTIRKPLKIEVQFGIQWRDRNGRFDTFSTEKDNLKVILDFNDKRWALFQKGLYIIRYWNLNKTEWEKQLLSKRFIEMTEEQKNYVTVIQSVFHYVNKKGTNELELKCRKMDPDNRDIVRRNNIQKWFLIEARRPMK